MKKRTIQIGDQPTPEMLEEIEAAAKHPDRYTDDAPKLSKAELEEFRPYYMVDHTLYKPRKVQISLRIDADVLEEFKRQGAGYQTRINEVLRAYIYSNAGV